ncbi:TPA: hypothetical protein ACH3X3_012036 [Trebouxia sp. C0006]
MAAAAAVLYVWRSFEDPSKEGSGTGHSSGVTSQQQKSAARSHDASASSTAAANSSSIAAVNNSSSSNIAAVNNSSSSSVKGNISSSPTGSSNCSSHGAKGDCSCGNCPGSGSRLSNHSSSGGTLACEAWSKLTRVPTAHGWGFTTAWAAAKRVDHEEHPQSSSTLDLIKMSLSGSMSKASHHTPHSRHTTPHHTTPHHTTPHHTTPHLIQIECTIAGFCQYFAAWVKAVSSSRVSAPANQRAAIVSPSHGSQILPGMQCGKGFVGLQNIGLTCYANCIVQCLVAIPQMASFFLSDAPVHDPGKNQRPISKAFSHLLCHMRASKHSVVYPDRFMRACAKANRQWKLWRQQDLHEFWVDLCHHMQEELCRIEGQKPYRELKGEDSFGQQALEYWEGHKAREASPILDIFGGQL